MCGLTAVLALNEMGVSMEDIDIFKQLMMVNTVRGIDGSGMFYVTDEDTWKKGGYTTGFIKNPHGPGPMFKSPEWIKISEAVVNSRFLVGHDRWATVGKIDVKNNHPFKKDHITMVHNGTLRFVDHELARIGRFDVDSQALCQILSIMPAEEALLRVHGAIAAIWYDSKDQKLKVFRNSERGLFYVKFNNKYYFASEAAMLKWILPRNRRAEDIEPTAVTEDTVYEFSHDEAEPELKKVDQFNRRYSQWEGHQRRVPMVLEAENEPDDNKGQFAWMRALMGHSPAPKQIPSVVLPFPTATKKEKKKYRILTTYDGVTVGDRLVLSPENKEWDGSAKRYTITFSPLANITGEAKIGSLALDASFIFQSKLTDAVDIFKADIVSATVCSIALNKKDPMDIRFHLANPKAQKMEGTA